MYSIKIIGAGSIGNHLAHAARRRNWNVMLTDRDPAALERARAEIYPGRYGAWDDEIELADTASSMAHPADVIFVGTPPDSHIALSVDSLEQAECRVLLIEKPLCTPDLEGAQDLLDKAREKQVFVAVGYNHCLAKSTVKAEEILKSGALGAINTISARTREHWAGIFTAHPWLAGPADSYLGYASRGGGALSEHSHAVNIWQHFAHCVGAGRITEVNATFDMVSDGVINYDRLSILAVRTESGLLGDIIQDVVTVPTDKSARIQGDKGHLEWVVNGLPDHDLIRHGDGEDRIRKTRADDFIAEIDHLAAVMEGGAETSPVALERGLDTMMVIAAAFRSHQTGARVCIDWSKGYRPEALD